MRRAIALVVLACALTSAVTGPAETLRVLGKGWILAPAVTSTPAGYVGVLVNISVVVVEGSGNVYVSTSPLTDIDMQGSARAAVGAACDLLGVDCSHYDFLFRVEADSVIVGGPSAGLVMGVLVASILSERPINRSVMATGMVAPDGSVGPVGGVLEKANVSARAGARLFLVPLGQSTVTTYVRRERRIGPFMMYSIEPVTINVTDYALKHWNLRVVEVVSLEDAVSRFLGLYVTERLREPEISWEMSRCCEEYSTALFEDAVRSLREAREIVEKEVGSSFTVKYLETRIEESEIILEEVAGIDDPVLRAARAVEVVARAEWARLLAEYAVGVDLTPYVTSIREEIEREWPRVASLMSSFYLAGAEEALFMAQKLWRVDREDSIYYLALAHAYATASKELSKAGVSESLLEVEEAAKRSVAEAGHTWSYVTLILGEAGARSFRLEAASIAFQLAKSSLTKREYIRALAHAIRALSLAEVSLDEIVVESAGRVKANKLSSYARGLVLRELGSLEGAVLAPLLLLRLGDWSSDPIVKLLSYRYALNFAKAAKRIVKGVKVAGGEVNVKTFDLALYAKLIVVVASLAVLASLIISLIRASLQLSRPSCRGPSTGT